MSKYSSVWEGKVHDWRFKVDMKDHCPEGYRHCFYLGPHLIGQIFRQSPTDWTAVPDSKYGPLPQMKGMGPVHGFRSRHKAADYCLQIAEQSKKLAESDEGSLLDRIGTLEAELWIANNKLKKLGHE